MKKELFTFLSTGKKSFPWKLALSTLFDTFTLKLSSSSDDSLLIFPLHKLRSLSGENVNASRHHTTVDSRVSALITFGRAFYSFRLRVFNEQREIIQKIFCCCVFMSLETLFWKDFVSRLVAKELNRLKKDLSGIENRKEKYKYLPE